MRGCAGRRDQGRPHLLLSCYAFSVSPRLSSREPLPLCCTRLALGAMQLHAALLPFGGSALALRRQQPCASAAASPAHCCARATYNTRAAQRRTQQRQYPSAHAHAAQPPRRAAATRAAPDAQAPLEVDDEMLDSLISVRVACCAARRPVRRALCTRAWARTCAFGLFVSHLPWPARAAVSRAHARRVAPHACRQRRVAPPGAARAVARRHARCVGRRRRGSHAAGARSLLCALMHGHRSRAAPARSVCAACLARRQRRLPASALSSRSFSLRRRRIGRRVVRHKCAFMYGTAG